MLSLTPAIRIFLAREPADMRKSMDGLTGLVTQELGRDAFSGHLFVFRNRRGDRVKILVWDGSGFWVLYKRLEKGRFQLPDTRGQSTVQIEAAEMAMVLGGFDLSRVQRQARYQPPAERPGRAGRKCATSRGSA